ncbi:MAG: putative membrane protein YkgB [Halobacteriales archaeon]|jgi:uncharacterized membrane protein YkgB
MSDSQRFDRFDEWGNAFDRIDRRVSTAMARFGTPIVRIGIGVVFVWFGALKLIGVSPAGELVAKTVYFLPSELFVPVLGVWEVLIGLCLLYRPLIRVGIFLLFLQMPGTFLPVVLLPDVVFTQFPYGLTVEGQYIVKNLVIIGAALVVGGTVRKGDPGDAESA